MHKINFKSHLTALHGVLIILVPVLIMFSFLFVFNDDDTYKIERVIGIATLISLSPSLYLHFCYYLENKDLIIRGLGESLEIKDTKRNKKWTLSNETILAIDVFAAPGMIEWGSAGGALHLSYHYAVIKTKEGEFILTSLLYPCLMDIKFKFREIKVNYHKTIFASI